MAATAFQAVVAALNGVNDANSQPIVVKFAVDDQGSGMVDAGPGGLTVTAEGSPTATANGGPCIADTTGNPNRSYTLNGTTQGFYLDVVDLLAGVSGIGVTLVTWFKGTNKTQQRSPLGFWRSTRYTTGMEISCNTNPVNGLVSTTNEVVLVSALGSGANGAWDYLLPNVGRCINDNTWNLAIYHARVNGGTMYTKLWVNDSDQPLTRLYPGVGTYTTGTDRVVIGGYSTGGSTRVYNFNDAVGPCAAFLGEPTQAQRRAILSAGTPSVGTIPRCFVHFRADVNVAGADEDEVVTWAADSSDSEVAATLLPSAGSTDGPILRTALLGGKSAIVADNSNRATAYQTMQDPALSAKLHPNLLTVAFAHRPGAHQIVGASQLDLLRMEAADGSQTAFGTYYEAEVFRDNLGGGSATFSNNTKPYLRTGPGLVFTCFTIDKTALTIYQDGETGFAPTIAAATIPQAPSLLDELYLFGKGETGGKCYHGPVHEWVAYRSCATATEVAALRAEMMGRWELGDESTTSDIEVIGTGDSIMLGLSSTGVKDWFSLLPAAAHGARYIKLAVASYTAAQTAALGWTSSARQYVAGTPSRSALVYATSINNIAVDKAAAVAAATSAANWWADVADTLDAYRVVRPTGTIIIVGPTPGDASQLAYRQAYEAKALAEIAAYGENCIYVSLESLIGVGTYPDGIHPNNVAHAAIAAKVWAAASAADPETFPAAFASGGTWRDRDFRPLRVR